MKTLLLMRHATAAEKAPLQTDFEKELTLLGEREAGQAGDWLKTHNYVPQLVLCSAATRARATCAGVLAGLEKNVPVQFENEIYSGSEKDLTYLLLEVKEEVDTVLVIGHNPTIAFFASQLAHQELAFSPADVAVLVLSINTWAEMKTATGKLSEFYQS